MSRPGPAALCATLLLLGLPAGARGHDVDVTSVARVFLEQLDERRWLLSVVDAKVPPIRNPGGVLPAGCRPLPQDAVGRAIPSGFAFECEEQLSTDDALVLPWALAGVVVLAHWGDGTDASAYFGGDGRAVTVRMGELAARAGSFRRLAARYFVLGVEHILLGVDHLLFVFGLMLLVRGTSSLVKTITAFTVAHSLTLALAVLGYVPVERAAVEATIALSVVLLAREIVMGHRGRPSLVHRRPWLVAFAFGLLHGLGFAGALGELGLRSADVPLALLSFNLGVEGGQLLFVAVLAGAARLVGRAGRVPTERLEPILGYGLGALATLWLLGRLPAVWGA